LAIVKTSELAPEATPESGSLTANPEIFNFTLANGSIVVCGKPRGVLKLRLRAILTPELLEDPEMVNIAQAFLSVQSIDNQPVWLKTANNFEAMMNRFASDEELDRFMTEYNKLVNPELSAAIEGAVNEAEELGLKPDQIKDFVAERVMAVSREQRQKIRD
jgi:hypothetical protein